MAKVSKNIKKFRTDIGLTQDMLAEKIHVTRQTVSSWENGRTQPDIEMLEQLALTLNIGIEELIYGEKNNVGLEPPKSDRRKIMNIVFATLGSLLTATGLIIIAVYYWSMIPDVLLQILSFVPLLLGGGVAAWTYTKKRTSIAWSEGASVAWVVGFIATYFFVISTFDVRVSFEDYIYIIIAVLIMPISPIMKSVFPLTVYYGFATFIFYEAMFPNLNFAEFAVCFILLLLGLPYVIRIPKSDPRRHFAVWITLVSSGIFAVILNSAATDSAEVPAILCTLIAIATALYSADKDIAAYPFKYIAVPAISVILCMLNFSIPLIYERSGMYDTQLFPVSIAPFTCAAIIAVGILIGRKTFKKNIAKTVFVAISCITAALTAICPIFAYYFYKDRDLKTALYVFTLLLGIAASVTLIVSGIKKLKLLTVNLGLIMLCVIIYFTLLLGRLDVIYGAIACTVMGIVLLVINAKLSKSFRKGEKNA